MGARPRDKRDEKSFAVWKEKEIWVWRRRSPVANSEKLTVFNNPNSPAALKTVLLSLTSWLWTASLYTYIVTQNSFFDYYTRNSKSLERAWSRGIVDRTKEYFFVLSTMPRLHARSRLLELGVLFVDYLKE